MKLALVALLSFSSGLAFAETASETTARGFRHFSRGEWKKAVEVLTAAAARLTDKKQRAQALKTIGLSEFELKRTKAAEEAFADALALDPSVELDPVEDSPRAIELFNALKAKMRATTAPVPAPTPGSLEATGLSRKVRETRVLPQASGLKPSSAPAPPNVLVTPAAPIARARNTRPWAWAAAGFGAAAVGVGAALFFGASSPARTERSSYDQGIDSYNARIDWGGGLLVAGTVSSIASVVLFLLHRGDPARAQLRDNNFRLAASGREVAVALSY